MIITEANFETTKSSVIRKAFHDALAEGSVQSGTERQSSMDMGRFELMVEAAQKFDALQAAAIIPFYVSDLTRH